MFSHVNLEVITAGGNPLPAVCFMVFIIGGSLIVQWMNKKAEERKRAEASGTSGTASRTPTTGKQVYDAPRGELRKFLQQVQQGVSSMVEEPEVLEEAEDELIPLEPAGPRADIPRPPRRPGQGERCRVDISHPLERPRTVPKRKPTLAPRLRPIERSKPTIAARRAERPPASRSRSIKRAALVSEAPQVLEEEPQVQAKQQIGDPFGLPSGITDIQRAILMTEILGPSVALKEHGIPGDAIM